jgi:hypothetical protein
MTQPNVSITELDGALAVLPPSAGKLYAIAGYSTSGPLNMPASFARTKDVIATYGAGPLVEKACAYIERFGKPVVIIRTGSSTAGTPGTLVITGVTGTSVVTVTGVPNDDYEALFKVLNGGTIGVAGILYQWSLDGGRNWSAATALGTANTFAFPGAGGLGLAFAAGTLVAGDNVSTRTTTPAPSAAELGAGLDALAASATNWEIVTPAGTIDGTAFDTLELKLAALAAQGKYRAWIADARMPNVGETEAQYKTALDGIFGSKATVYGMLCAGACKITSSVTGRKYRRPISFIVGAREAASSEEVNNADPNLGPLGVTIRDANGNPDEHDESVNPGLDDSRFTTLRTIDGLQGVYVNRPRLFSPAGSDFQLLPHRRVMNLGHAALRTYFMRRLNKPVLVDALTGYLLEEEALEIEAGALAVMRATLTAKPKASGVMFALSRTDNLLSTKTMTGDARIIPLAYPEFITLTVGFYNPALQVQAV